MELSTAGVPARHYHADMDPAPREAAHAAWSSGQVQVRGPSPTALRLMRASLAFLTQAMYPLLVCCSTINHAEAAEFGASCQLAGTGQVAFTHLLC